MPHITGNSTVCFFFIRLTTNKYQRSALQDFCEGNVPVYSYPFEISVLSVSHLMGLAVTSGFPLQMANNAENVSMPWWHHSISKIARFMGPTGGPPGSCRPQMGPMMTPWILLSGMFYNLYGWAPGNRNCSNTCGSMICYRTLSTDIPRAKTCQSGTQQSCEQGSTGATYQPTVMWKCYTEEISITGCTGSRQFDNFQ